jgi:hypothetical protein
MGRTTTKVDHSPEYERYLKNDKETDPVFKNGATVKAYATTLGLKTTNLQYPQCSLERYFPRQATPFGLVRYIPNKSNKDLPLCKDGRGAHCWGGKECHNRGSLPAFMYT